MAVIAEYKIAPESIIYIPTGDGLCISLINVVDPYDVHIQIAISILDKLFEKNRYEIDSMREFEVRIGVNENVDNLVTDINGKTNVAGSGINLAQRIMSLASGSQILVSQSVYDRLSNREKYINRFREFKAAVKHSLIVNVYQLMGGPDTHLDLTIPKALSPHEEWQFNESQATLLATIISNEEFIKNHRGAGQNNYALFVLMTLLAEDTLGAKTSIPFSPYASCLPLPGKSLEDNFTSLMSLPFSILNKYHHLYFNYNIGRLWGQKYLNFSTYYLEVSEAGKKKLIAEWPRIAEEFGI